MGSATEIGINVKSMASGAVVFSVNSEALHTPMPASGRFLAEIELQMNVAPGLYSIHAVVKRRNTRRAIQGGPWVSVKVSGTTVSGGVAQMNPRIHLREHELSEKLTT